MFTAHNFDPSVNQSTIFGHDMKCRKNEITRMFQFVNLRAFKTYRSHMAIHT